jgi:hypothetical protein
MKELFKDKLSIIANDPLLIEAIKDVFINAIEANKPRIDEINDNNVLGEKFRAFEQAKKLIDQSFYNISALKKIKASPKTFNKAR